jgi:hypothetical protein
LLCLFSPLPLGENPEDNESIGYEFSTSGERKAFMDGMDAADGWDLMTRSPPGVPILMNL